MTHSPNNDAAPVGVVPRRRAASIEPLMSDTLDVCTVAEGVASPGPGRSLPPLPHWLSAMASVGVVAAALEWMKLTR
ncbi:MAG: hypothetical protein WB783_12750 [Arenicellales bacterium]